MTHALDSHVDLAAFENTRRLVRDHASPRFLGVEGGDADQVVAGGGDPEPLPVEFSGDVAELSSATDRLDPVEGCAAAVGWKLNDDHRTRIDELTL